MTDIACPHKDATEVRRMCEHLVETDHKYRGVYRQYTGVKFDYNVVCAECCKHEEQIEASLRNVCLDCFKRCTNFYGFIGLPEFRRRASNLSFSHMDVTLKEPPAEKLLDVKPVSSEQASIWVALTASGQLVKIDFDNQAVTYITQLSDPHMKLSEEITLHLSPRAEFAAVVNTYGQFGAVLDLKTDRQTMALDRDDYHIEHCVFSAAFIEVDGRSLLIHATDWNRLDISDPASGKLLTGRGPTSYSSIDGESEPEHYLDYFHCGLTVSPDHRWVADNGWVWQPCGILRTWSIDRWLKTNIWESEEGESIQDLRLSGYSWDIPMCWVDNRTLAAWGKESEDWEIEYPAACLYDVVTGKEKNWFIGPDGHGAFEFDVYLFAFSESHGTSVWDIETGERLLADDTLRPKCYHRGSQQFLTQLSDASFRLSCLIDHE